MKRFTAIFTVVLIALACCISGTALAKDSVPPSLVLIYNGFSQPNVHTQPTIPAFAQWCNGTCVPSTQEPVYDAKTGQAKGNIYVWTTTPFDVGAGGTSFCFAEFIMYVLNDGTLYTQAHPDGTCGGSMDPSLKPATHLLALGDPAPFVVAGGGDGVIVGGTGKYTYWTGTYTDRVFVELDFTPGYSQYYYDQLFFAITPDPQ